MTAPNAPIRLVIIGGVAGGASAATRARRLSENAEIIILERGPYVSFANCGLPYHIGGVIPKRESLVIHSPQSLGCRFNIDVRTHHQAMTINREEKVIKVLNLKDNQEYELPYDKLILSPGARAFRPPVQGLDQGGVFNLQTITEMDQIIDWIKTHNVEHASVVGAGFIGVEVAENLRHLGLEVNLIELGPQAMPNMDRDMAELLHQNMVRHGVDLRLNTKLTGISRSPDPAGGEASLALNLELGDGTRTTLPTQLVVIAAGVRPRTDLAQEAGLKLGVTGGIQVNERLETSDEHIYAIGDAVEVTSPISNRQVLIPLAGPASRQGRMAADQIFGRKNSRYRGTLGTSICKVFDLTAGAVGLSQRMLTNAKIPFETATVHTPDHAGYYPGSTPITLKMHFDPEEGSILGAQIIGINGVAKRLDVISTAMAGKLTVFDLEHLELAYAPPFNSAKDPVNMVGLVAANMISGDHNPIQPAQLEELRPRIGKEVTLLDVRSPIELGAGKIPGSILIPLDELRNRLSELSTDQEYIVYCHIGQRGYVAQRILDHNGFRSKNLVGGYASWLIHTGQIPDMEIPLQFLAPQLCMPLSVTENQD